MTPDDLTTTYTERRLLLMQNKEHLQAQVEVMAKQIALVQREIDAADGALAVLQQLTPKESA